MDKNNEISLNKSDHISLYQYQITWMSILYVAQLMIIYIQDYVSNKKKGDRMTCTYLLRSGGSKRDPFSYDSIYV